MLAVLALALVIDQAVVVGRVDDGSWTDAATEARIDQKAELAAIVIAHRGKRRVVLVPDGVTAIKLRGRSVPARELEPLTGAKLEWFAVEPHGFRKTTARNGATSSFYSNVSMEAKTFGKWLGYDQVEYFERALTVEQPIIGAVIDSPDATIAGLGTQRFKVGVELADGVRVASPGAEATDTFGILPSVHRVSIRKGDDFLGWLAAYLLVPEVFGSAGPGRNHQSERFTGADCADVMIGALRRSGSKRTYTNVAGLTAYAKTIATATEVDERGMPAQPITGVRAGDLIRIDYGGVLRGHTPRHFDHVAALWEDRSDPTGPHKGTPDGKLDGFDLIIHMGHPRLKIESLAGQSPGTVDVLRWR